MRGAGRRRPKESFNPAPPQTPQYRRDSDASFASSRPSSIGMIRSSCVTVDMYKERSVQLSAVNTINTALKELFGHPNVVVFKPFSPPSLKDLIETVNSLLQCLDYHSTKLEDDLPIILKALNYPFKINKSILKTPPAPHQWHPILALIHWLVQIAMYDHHLVNESQPFMESNSLNVYTLNGYLHYISGDDDAEMALDKEFVERVERERDNGVERLKVLGNTISELEAKADELRSALPQSEVLMKEKSLLEEDVNKFHTMISGFSEKMEELKKVLEEKEKGLEAKVEEKERICEENEELKRRVESQTFNPRDVERMRRELQAVERDIGEAEVLRNAWEEKSWDLDATLGHKFKEIEALAMECNQAMRRLKLDNGIQYTLNPKGSTAAEVMGVDHKTTVRPALDAFTDDIKKSSLEKLEDLISLRQQSSGNNSQIDSKRKHIAALDSHIAELEDQLNLLKKETQEYTLRCSVEAKKMLDDLESESYNVDIMEREAEVVLKTAKMKLQEAVKQTKEELQSSGCELLALVDSISKYKEFMASKFSQMKNDVSETALAVANAYKGSFPPQFGVVFPSSS